MAKRRLCNGVIKVIESPEKKKKADLCALRASFEDLASTYNAVQLYGIIEQDLAMSKRIKEVAGVRLERGLERSTYLKVILETIQSEEDYARLCAYWMQVDTLEKDIGEESSAAEESDSEVEEVEQPVPEKEPGARGVIEVIEIE